MPCQLFLALATWKGLAPLGSTELQESSRERTERRKACIPSAPVFGGIHDAEAAALAAVIGNKSLTAFTRQREVVNFADGTDTFQDSPITFADPRQFAPRRVKLRRDSELEE